MSSVQNTAFSNYPVKIMYYSSSVTFAFSVYYSFCVLLNILDILIVYHHSEVGDLHPLFGSHFKAAGSQWCSSTAGAGLSPDILL